VSSQRKHAIDMCEPYAKARTAILGRVNAEIDARSKGMAQALNRVLLMWAEREVRDAIRGLSGSYNKAYPHSEIVESAVAVQKSAISRAALKRQLLALYRQFGLRQFAEGGKRGAKAGNGKWILTPDMAAQFNDALESKVVLLISETEQRVKSRIRQIVSDALREEVRPTQAEVGRRIARSFMGPPTGTSPEALARQEAWPGRHTDEEDRITADWARREQGLKDGDREYIFDFTRAQTIARNEIANAENAGIANGYAVAGVESVDWLSYPRDGRSGKREHWKMNKHPPILVVDMMGTDEDKWFKLPHRGERAPFPKAPNLSAFNSINCRCLVVPTKRAR